MIVEIHSTNSASSVIFRLANSAERSGRFHGLTSGRNTFMSAHRRRWSTTGSSIRWGRKKVMSNDVARANSKAPRSLTRNFVNSLRRRSVAQALVVVYRCCSPSHGLSLVAPCQQHCGARVACWHLVGLVVALRRPAFVMHCLTQCCVVTAVMSHRCRH